MNLIIFVDGAGNLGHGGQNLEKALAGTADSTRVEQFTWTTSFNPLIDQLNVGAAKRRSMELATRIRRFREESPDGQVNVVSFSAGTGVAVWACEQLDEYSSVDKLILLGSSLSYDYDMSRAARNVNREIVVYHSSRDAILQAVRWIGTIDGRRGVNAAGLVGVSVPNELAGKIVNVSWSPEMVDLGWRGGHDDSTSLGMARGQIAPRLLDHSNPDGPGVAVECETSGTESGSF
ncbi:MAG: hypothetical protein ACYTHJ_07905 [Planctomycetota bacterium]